MSVGLVGKKCGMTRVFTESGVSIPVTVVHVDHNVVADIKPLKTDQFKKLVVSQGQKASSRLRQSELGFYAKAKVMPGRSLHEFSVDSSETWAVGDPLTVEIFEAGQKVDVRGTTRGKGFAGAVKRHNFKMQDATHGNSISHRAPGSIGQCQTPGRVLKGKKMAGHMGNVARTVQNLEIVKVDLDRSIVLIKGAVPGAPDGRVFITPSVKKKGAQ